MNLSIIELSILNLRHLTKLDINCSSLHLIPGKSGANFYDLKKRLNPNFDWDYEVASITGDMDIEEVCIQIIYLLLQNFN